MIAGVVTTKRALDFVVKAVAAAAFVVCVEWLFAAAAAKKPQRKGRGFPAGAVAGAAWDRSRTRDLRHRGHARRIRARLLACSVAQVRPRRR